MQRLRSSILTRLFYKSKIKSVDAQVAESQAFFDELNEQLKLCVVNIENNFDERFAQAYGARIDEVNNVIRYQHELNNLKEHTSLLQFFRISKLCVEIVKPLSELQQELTSIQFKFQQELDREVNQTM